MNIQKLILLILISNSACMSKGMELPKRINAKKFDGDRRFLLACLQRVEVTHRYENTEVGLATFEQRNLFLQNFKNVWRNVLVSSAKLDYTFESYMNKAGIDTRWMEEWYSGSAATRIKITEFVHIVRDRFNKNLDAYLRGEEQ